MSVPAFPVKMMDFLPKGEERQRMREQVALALLMNPVRRKKLQSPSPV